MDDPNTADASGASPEQIAAEITQLGAAEAARALTPLRNSQIIEVLQRLNPAVVGDIIPELDDDRREALLASGPSVVTQQWSLNATFDEDRVGRLMDPPTAVFRPTDTIGTVSNHIRDLVKRVFVTYCWVTDNSGKLLGIITMRDLLVTDDAVPIGDVMLRDPFFLKPGTPLKDAMKEVLHKHYPVYPVCDTAGRLIGIVRGQSMFEEQAFEISAQPGRMVGVDKEERLTTPWTQSLKFRHPWLQLNLLTAFLAAGVVGIFQHTLDQMVILALFLPVLAGQSGNTGCQALAVTLRGLTLGELNSGSEASLVSKEARLGFANGALVGITAGLGMYIVARMQSNPAAASLGMIVTLAMIVSCVVSGIAGAMIPLTLRKLGADPATASSIFLTTATDVASMGVFLGLSTLLLVR